MARLDVFGSAARGDASAEVCNVGLLVEFVPMPAKALADACDRITDGPRIVDFRNQLTHEYVRVNDTVVWDVIERNLTTLRSECAALLSELDREHGDR